MINYQSYKGLKIITVIFLCILFTLNVIPASYANSPPLVMEGSTAFPINSDYIVLEKETINIKYGKDKHSVEVFFHFFNSGPETDLLIGFPNVANYGETLYDFKAFQYPDMIEYEVEEKAGGLMPGLDQYMYESMYAWTMHFKEGERQTLLVTYKFHNTTMSDNDYGSAGYILKTGALWKDKIGSIDVYVEFPEKAAYHEITASPSGYYYNGSGIEWHFNSIEPDFDLDISYHKLPDNLKYDWMYEPKTKMPVSDYIWKDRIFVVDLFERWNLDETFYFTDDKSESEIRNEAKKLLENCLLVKNEILARHGIKLSDEWHDFFKQFPWYTPHEYSYSDISDVFNETEKLNIELIQIYQEHIFPDADAETIKKGMQDLYEKYGDDFFRYYPVLNRMENRETIQAFINQRIEGWREYKPLHLGQASPGYVRSPAILNKAEVLYLENTHNHGQTENGYSILETTDDRLLLEKENTFYDIYKRTVPDTMYERRHEIPNNSAFLMNLEFHDSEIRDIISKWCKEVKDPETGEIMNLTDDLLILPEEGEKYVLTGFTVYNKISAWSDNYNYLAYPLELDGVPYLHVFDIENRHLMRYRLPERGEFQEIVVLNDGSGFFPIKDKIYYFSYLDDVLFQYEDLEGQIIDFDYKRESLIYINQKEIRQFSLKSGNSVVFALPKEIWKIEKQDQNNYMLYCHPEYYYIFNMPTQNVFRYPQITDYPNLLIYSPSGTYRLEQFFVNPPALTKGNADKQTDKTYEPEELKLPVTHRYEWFSDREIVVTEYLNVTGSDDQLILEHIYDVEKGEKLLTLCANKTYTEKVMAYVKDGCYFHDGRPVLANAMITDINAFPGSIFTENPDYKSGLPVGILETNDVSSKVVYYYPWNGQIFPYDIDNKYLRLTEGLKARHLGFIVDTVVYVDASGQDILLEKCSAFVTTSMKSNNRIKVKIANVLEGWVDKEDLVPGFVSADKTQITSLTDDPAAESTPENQPASAGTTETSEVGQDEAMEAMKTTSAGKEVADIKIIFIIIAVFLIFASAGVYLTIRENHKQREK